MSMAGKRYYGADVPRSTGPHPDPLEQLRDQDRLRASLQYYAATYCEGWCKDNPPNANFEDCDGCRARLALTDSSQHQNPQEKQ